MAASRGWGRSSGAWKCVGGEGGLVIGDGEAGYKPFTIQYETSGGTK